MTNYKLNNSHIEMQDGNKFLNFIAGNVGVDLYNEKYCGNTLLISLFLSEDIIFLKEYGEYIYQVSQIAGKYCRYLLGSDLRCYQSNKLDLSTKDYYFYYRCPLKMKNELGLVLFNILCSINFIITFLEDLFISDLPQKFKFAYLLYYYLCGFIQEVNEKNNLNLYVNDKLINRDLRNCIAHYGLGVVMEERDLKYNDPLFGLTNKTLNLDYPTSKEKVYKYLSDLAKEIETYIF